MTFSSRKVDIRELGADPLGGGDIGPIITNCFNNGITPLYVGGRFRQQTPAIVPEGKRLEAICDVSASVFTDQDIPLFKFIRISPGLQYGTNLRLVDFVVDQDGAQRESAWVEFRGLDSTWDDNTLTIAGSNTVFRRWKHGVRAANARVVFDAPGSRAAFNDADFCFGYNTSFSEVIGLVSQSSNYGIYADSELYKPAGAPAYDGITNTMNLTRSTWVNTQKTDLFVRGWDAVNSTDCGFDLGGSGAGTGTAAVMISRTSNVNFNSTYVSSSSSASSRRGLVLEDCVKSRFAGNRFNTSNVGFHIRNPLGLPGSHIISENYFGGNTGKHCFVDGAKGVTVTGNKFDDTPNRVGMNYPLIVSGPGNHYLNVRQNDFAGAAYALYPAGGDPGVVVEPQRWGVPIV